MANITIVATGGTRAPTQIDLMQRFVADGHRVRLIASRNARRFLFSHMIRRPWKFPSYLRRYRPALMETLAYYKDKHKSVPHISEGKWSDVVVMAPATCNSVGKLVAGITDNYPLQVIRAVPRTKKVLVVPSMNPEMWYDPQFQRNVDLLNATEKYRVLCPARGMMLSGDFGFGAQVSFEDIVAETYRVLGIVNEDVEALLERGGAVHVPWEGEAALAEGEFQEVVLVDADRSLREDVARALLRQYPDLRVHQFDSATTALEWIADHPPVLVFTELAFAGGASGFDLIEHCRRPGAEGVHLIAASTGDRREIGAERLARQEVLYLPKPLNIPFAVGMVGGCLQGQARRTVMRTRKLDSGEVLFREGDRGTEVYLVRAGMLRIVKGAGNGAVELGRVEAQGMVGEMALLGNQRRAATVEAVEPTELIELDMDDARTYLERQPAWLRALIESLIQHVRATGERLAEAGPQGERE